MKLKKFKKNTAVRINSKEDYILLMELAGKSGWKWNSGDSADSKNDNPLYYKSEAIVFDTYDSSMTCCESVDDISHDEKIITMRQAVKFEVGDKVRVRKDLDKCDKEERPKIVIDMVDMIGNEYEIEHIYTHAVHNNYRINGWEWLKKWLEPVASCDAVEPEWEQEKEPEREKEQEPEYFTGEVVCVESSRPYIRAGKVYKFVEGKTIDEDGDHFPLVGVIRSLEDFNDLIFYKFIEVSGRCENPQGFTGKVICTEAKNSFTTTGKIYEFVNGISVNDFGNTLPRNSFVKNVEQLNNILWSDFIEVVE